MLHQSVTSQSPVYTAPALDLYSTILPDAGLVSCARSLASPHLLAVFSRRVLELLPLGLSRALPVSGAGLSEATDLGSHPRKKLGLPASPTLPDIFLVFSPSPDQTHGVFFTGGTRIAFSTPSAELHSARSFGDIIKILMPRVRNATSTDLGWEQMLVFLKALQLALMCSQD